LHGVSDPYSDAQPDINSIAHLDTDSIAHLDTDSAAHFNPCPSYLLADCGLENVSPRTTGHGLGTVGKDV